MDLLFHQPTCSVCGEECVFHRYQLKDGSWLCQDCCSDAGFESLFDGSAYDLAEFKQIMTSRQARLDEIHNFHPSKRVGDILVINEKRQRWYTLCGKGGKRDPAVYDFADIVSYELLEDSATIPQGGALFGQTGAIVGSNTEEKRSSPDCTMLKIKITLRSMDDPIEYINLVSGKLKRSGFLFKQLYQAAQECTALLAKMISIAQGEAAAQPAVVGNAADEILEYQNLLAAGAITQDEYDVKKAKLRGH